jgi:hypothetical protein
MTDVKPVLPSQPTTKRRSIKTRFLLWLLVLSLLPLGLLVAISHYRTGWVQEHVRSELIRVARYHLVRLAEDQATIISNKLDKVADETRTAAFLVQALPANPAAFSGARSECTAEKPDNPDAACSYSLAPGVSVAAAQPVLDLSGNLEKVFAFVKEGDPSLEEIYYVTQSGVYLEYPWHNETLDSLAFTLEPAFAQYLNQGGEIPEQVRRAFSQNGVDLSQNTVVSTTDPDNKWLIRDSEKNWIFPVSRGKTGLTVKWEYDPRYDPWYLDAVGRDRVVWTKYANWSGAQFLFELKPGIEITDKVSPGLARAFEDRQIHLLENSPVLIKQGGRWRLRDKNGIYYDVRA